MKRSSRISIAVSAVVATGGISALYAQSAQTAAAAPDKYTLVSPGGIKFSDFKGYEDWAVISSARTDKELKVILGNPVMIQAYKAGVPLNGKPFPEGSKSAKLQWTFKKSTEAPFVVDVPDAPTQVFFMEKDSKRFPDTGGWGYAVFNHVKDTGGMVPDAAKADCGQVCHVAVKSKDYVFHPYQKR